LVLWLLKGKHILLNDASWRIFENGSRSRSVLHVTYKRDWSEWNAAKTEMNVSCEIIQSWHNFCQSVIHNRLKQDQDEKNHLHLRMIVLGDYRHWGNYARRPVILGL
jgi:hypothetical protein